MTEGRTPLRARDWKLGIWHIPTGPWNAITDVPGVLVGHRTVRVRQRVQTGVTVVWPHDGDLFRERVFVGVDVLNGNTVLTGQAILDEWGLLGSPIVLTSSRGAGIAYEAVIQHFIERDPEISRLGNIIPVVGECDDNYLSDNRQHPVTVRHVKDALRAASSGPVPEGGVGAGTGMQLFGWKGGIGTASRRVAVHGQLFTVGVLVNANFGQPHQLIVGGIPVGGILPTTESIAPEGSCVGVVATDAPLAPDQLRRLAKRMGLGLARTGSVGNDGSGEIFIAFSTATRIGRDASEPILTRRLLTGQFWTAGSPIDVLFEATVEATEEAVLNALVAGKTTRGRDGHVLPAFPTRIAREILQRPESFFGDETNPVGKSRRER
jgi:D-aminopeptidase